MLDWRLYKEGQGLWARNSVAAVIALMSVFAAIRLYETLIDPSSYEIVESRFEQWISVSSWPFDYRFLIVGPFLVALLAFGVWQYNHPTWADFLIDTENEMKNRVTWPGRKELFNNSVVVVVSVLLIGGFIFTVDFALLWVFRWIYG